MFVLLVNYLTVFAGYAMIIGLLILALFLLSITADDNQDDDDDQDPHPYID